MNTGIGDAVNLAWKLAAVVHGQAHAGLLDSYEPERLAFARRLVASTDRAFTAVTSRGAIAKRVRLNLAPLLLPPLFELAAVRRLMFRTISQTAVHYRASRLSVGRAGTIHGRDRLPWVPPDSEGGQDNFTPLTSLEWQVHVYGAVAPELIALCGARGLPLHVFSWGPTIARAGLTRNAVYLVRPDGYVALAEPEASAAKLKAYLDEWGVITAATSSRRPASH